MAEKLLTESAWKGFAKGRGVKDAALLKAITALERSEKRPAGEQLEALTDLDKQITALTKEAKADKEVVKQLDDMAKAVVRARKEAEKLRDAEAAAAEDEDESPALLTSKMLPLVRELRKGETRMPALIATAGKEAAVLIMRRAISPTRRKLLKEALPDGGTPKFITGECAFEDGALTFIVQSEAAGLAKKLRAAVLQQLELRLKVRVRGEDGQSDEDGEDDAVAGNPQAAQAQQFRERRAALEAPLQSALSAKHPESTRLRGVMGFADDKAEAADFTAALKALDTLEKLLEPPAAPTAPDGEGAQLASALAGWRDAQASVLIQLREVEREIKEDLEEDPSDSVTQRAELQLAAVIRQIGGEPTTADQVKTMGVWLEGDEVLGDVDRIVGNVRAPLLQALEGLRAAVAPTR